jgi:hypothetical protein
VDLDHAAFAGYLGDDLVMEGKCQSKAVEPGPQIGAAGRSSNPDGTGPQGAHLVRPAR